MKLLIKSVVFGIILGLVLTAASYFIESTSPQTCSADSSVKCLAGVSRSTTAHGWPLHYSQKQSTDGCKLVAAFCVNTHTVTYSWGKALVDLGIWTIIGIIACAIIGALARLKRPKPPVYY